LRLCVEFLNEDQQAISMNPVEFFRVATGACSIIIAPALNAVEIIGHRGAAYDAPENTLVSFKTAWTQNADAIETDMWLSKDGKIVIMHDGDTKRVGGSTNKIAAQNWEDLQRLDVGGWKGEQFKGERIPTLESLLAEIPPGKRAVLEIKCGPEIVPELVRVIRESRRKPADVAIIAFKFDALKESKAKLPEIEHYFLYDYKTNWAGALPKLAPIIAQAKSAKFDGLDLQFKWPIDKAFVKEVKDAGLKLVVWTVNDPVVAKRLVEAGVDGITTDRPGWLREQLKQ
jgi:glycerophosphoryl diester phosphodiesterase